MTLWKQFIVMACIIAALLIWDRQLAANRHDAAANSNRIGAFVSQDLFADRPVAAVKYESAGQPFLYVFHEGLWRCVGFNNAPAIESRVSALTPALLSAHGTIVSHKPDEAASYGFGSDATIRLSFCGQYVLQDRAGDKIIEFDVGHTIPGTGGCFVRKMDSNDIWAINVDFHTIIGANPESGLPPMVDSRLIPESWGGFREGISAITIQRADEPPIICRRGTGDGGTAESETQPTAWTVQRGETTQPGIDTKFFLFTQFLSNAHFIGLPSRRTPEEFGLNKPHGTLRLETTTGKILELTVGGAGPHGGVIVHNDFSATVYEISRVAAQALLPEMDALTVPTQDSPWDQWIQ